MNGALDPSVCKHQLRWERCHCAHFSDGETEAHNSSRARGVGVLEVAQPGSVRAKGGS